MKIKKISVLILFFILNLLLANKVFAATLTFSSSKDEVGIGEQFYVDLMLDPEGQSINAISGNIIFSNESISFVRSEEGKSMVNLWVEKPELNKDWNSVNFAGVMTNGFDGVIDPFNPSKKLSGQIVRLIFETKKPGLAEFSSSKLSLNLNDGFGTEIKISPINTSINVLNYINEYKYEISDEHSSPELEAYITRDPNIFNNKYVLIFKASDKGSGIKSVTIKEGRRKWKEIESPYQLKDQSRHSQINLQAINYSGSGIIINIDKIPYNKKEIAKILVIISGAIILFIFLGRKLHKIKKKIL